MAWWSSWIQVGTDQPDAVTPHPDSSRDGNPALENQGQLEGMGVF
jgi:hypothetical protein